MALDGKVTIDVCQQQITAKGDGKIVEVPVGGGETTYLWKDRAFKLKGKLDLEVSGYGFLGSISNSFFDVASKAFNVEASGALRFPGFTGGVLDGEAQAIVSSTGIAACFGKPDERVGIGQRWGEAIKPFALSCDLGPYRVSGAAAVPP